MRRTNCDHNTDDDQRGGQVPGVFVPELGFFTDAASPDLRARIIADMRALADFLEEHPGLPISPHTSVEVSYFPRTNIDEAAFEEVAEAASRVGRIPAWEGEHYVVEHRHGAGRYRVVAIPEQVRSRYRAWLTYTGHVRQD
ncbi:hypothetical protein NE857_26040 [Nocardiopsis exhalans]|uniref:Uncharacterized protein n=2 Tax=Nocardiopsis TaxID=2013 RepID=A0A840WK79_9ACTN|nr:MULTISPECIES: hypothetical protein [Nocardiopsis]MBB5492255.1 hypothetical protein [Nocardiopsis metallicus]USY18718.1 hypothetical protein NE857_26040 [Nocardiopsis exhalans]